MLEYGVTTLQAKPSLFKHMDISKIVDKRKNQELGYFIPSRYKDVIEDKLKQLERLEKIKKLKKLQSHQDIEFLEVGVDDGIA